MFIRLAVVASLICKIPWNSRIIRTYSSSRLSKVIDLGANQKCICNFLLVINSNIGCVSYHFRDIDAFCCKSSFSLPHLCFTPLSGSGIPCDISLIYTALTHKIHLMVLSANYWVWKKQSHFASQLITYEILVRSLPNLA